MILILLLKSTSYFVWIYVQLLTAYNSNMTIKTKQIGSDFGPIQYLELCLFWHNQCLGQNSKAIVWNKKGNVLYPEKGRCIYFLRADIAA